MAAVGGKKRIWLYGALLGLAAGISAVVLPKSLGLPEESSNKTLGTKIMTVGLYLIGGLAAAAVAKMVDKAGGEEVEEEEKDNEKAIL